MEVNENWNYSLHKIPQNIFFCEKCTRLGRKTIYISQTAQQVQTQNANLQLFNNVTTFLKMYASPLLFRVIYKLLASKSESIRVQALKVLGYFLKHLGHKWVLIIKIYVWRPVYEVCICIQSCIWYVGTQRNLGWVISIVGLIIMFSFSFPFLELMQCIFLKVWYIIKIVSLITTF